MLRIFIGCHARRDVALADGLALTMRELVDWLDIHGQHDPAYRLLVFEVLGAVDFDWRGIMRERRLAAAELEKPPEQPAEDEWQPSR